MEKVFNKLVRDRIPEIIENNNEVPIIRILELEDYKKELFRKLKEECEEVCNAKNNDELLEELADVLEVIKALAFNASSSIITVHEIADKKREKRGGFEKRIYLEKTYKKIVE